MTELGGGRCVKGESVSGQGGSKGARAADSPIRLWIALVLWLGLGLGRKPDERPEVDDGEREGAALLLLGVLRGLLEVVEQPRVVSYQQREK